MFKGIDSPEKVGLPTVEENYNGKKEVMEDADQYLGFKPTIKLVLLNKSIWIVAISMFFLDFIRIGFMFWAITYLFEDHQTSVSLATYSIMIIPVAGSMDALFSSWLANKYLKRKSVRIIQVMLLLLVEACFIFMITSKSNWILSLIMLVLMGFFLYGPHVLMSAFLPMEYVSREASATAAGFISGWGYIGSAITGILSGFLADNFGWNSVFYLWMSGGLVAAVLMAVLWNYRPLKRKYH